MCFGKIFLGALASWVLLTWIWAMEAGWGLQIQDIKDKKEAPKEEVRCQEDVRDPVPVPRGRGWLLVSGVESLPVASGEHHRRA